MLYSKYFLNTLYITWVSVENLSLMNYVLFLDINLSFLLSYIVKFSSLNRFFHT